MTAPGTTFKGAAMLMATAVAWGGMFPVIKPLLGDYDPITLTMLRFGLAVPVLLLLLVLIEGPAALRPEGRALRLWGLGTLGFAGFGLLLVLGLERTAPHRAAVMPALMPLIAIVIGAVRGRAAPSATAVTAVLLGLVGVILVVSGGEPLRLLHGGVGGGEALVLLGATCWVLYTLDVSTFAGWSGLRVTTLSLTAGTASIAAIWVLCLTAKISHVPSIALLTNTMPALAYLVLAASVMGFLFWNAGMHAIGAKLGVLFIIIVPITAFALAVVDGARPGPLEYTGVLLVITALLLNSLVPGIPATRQAA